MKQRLIRPSLAPAAIQRQPFFVAANGASPGARVQRKLAVGAAGDQYEQQADAMADKVVHRIAQSTTQVQKKCAECEVEEHTLQRQAIEGEEGEETLQAKSDTALVNGSDGSASVSPQVEQRLHQNVGGGTALPPPALERMSGAFGIDFSSVRLHTYPEAVQLSHELGARAFTYGRDVFFGQSGYDPESSADNHLLAHELTHVVQQSGANGVRAGNNIKNGGSFPVPVLLQRQPLPAAAPPQIDQTNADL